MISSTPNTPPGWQQLAQSHSIPDLPYRSLVTEDVNSYTQRDVYVDAVTVLRARKPVVEAYADILALQDATVAVTVADGGYVTLSARVVTASVPVNLTVNFTGKADAAFTMYAEQLDQPISIVEESGKTTPVQLGKSSPNVAVQVLFSAGSTTVTYLTGYEPLELMSNELLKLAQTQLRMASILFWLAPDVAQDLSFHVAQICAASQIGSSLNIQANALAQQLTITKMTGPGTNYAPTLTLETYEKTLAGAIDVTETFSKQYDAFTSRTAQIADQKAAWDTMLQHAADTLSVQTRLASDAHQKLTDARDALSDASLSLRNDNIELADRKMRFQLGIDAWKEQQEFEATVKILFAVFTFVIAIGLLAVGDPAPAAGAPTEAANAVKAVQTAAESAKSVEKILDPSNLKALKDGVEAIGKLYDSSLDIDKALNDLNNSGASLPIISDADSQPQDISSLTQMAAWDKWALDVDAQMDFAVSNSIDGAAEYRLSLRKYSIDGKLVTQCRAEAIKAGHEYFERQMAVYVTQQDFTRLKQLRQTYQGEIDVAKQAAEAFYDRKMSTITSVLIEMRKAMWAFKYMSLKDSRVTLDPLKTIEDYKADAQTLVQEVEDWRDNLTSDFSPFNESYPGSQLSSVSGQPIVDLLKSNGNADFTLSPPHSLGPFENASHVRIIGMRVYLIGAVAKDPSKTTSMEMTISSSGICNDIQNNTVFTFVMRPDSRRFKYTLSPTITIASGDNDSLVTIDSFIPSQVFADPTPFTQWTISITNPTIYNLSGLTDVKLVWKGRMK